MMVRKIVVIVALLSMLILSACSGIGGVPSELQCTVDSDCVAAECCHSATSVNRDNAPNCQGVLCSAICEEGTLDCGFAKARCVEGACRVVPIE